MASKQKDSSETVPSTPLIPPTRWAAGSFLLSAGCCMLQPSEDGSTAKVVVVYDTAKRRYFLPRGRKDIGETLEQAGFREGYEARTTMVAMTQVTDDRQPVTPELKQLRRSDPNNSAHWLTTNEPIYITTIPVSIYGYEYITFWYAAQVPLDAVWEADTGMPDEKTYVGKLLSYEEAIKVLADPESYVLWITYNSWRKTQDILKGEKEDRAKEEAKKAGTSKVA